MSVPDLAPDDDDEQLLHAGNVWRVKVIIHCIAIVNNMASTKASTSKIIF